MNKIYSIAILILLALIIALNFGINKYYESDKSTFYENLNAHFIGNAYDGYAYTTKEYDEQSGKWEMDWIVSDNYYENNDQVVGLVVISLYPEEQSLQMNPKSYSFNAYQFARTNGSDGMYKFHKWNYIAYTPDKEAIVNTTSQFFKLEKRDWAFPIDNGHGQTIGQDITTIAQKSKEYYVRVSNGNIWVIVGIANTFLITLFILIFHLIFGSKISKIKKEEKEIQLDKEQGLWSVLERKCNPNRFMSPYNKEMVDKANTIYACLQGTKDDDIESLKDIRRKIESELGVTFVDMMEVEKLKALANPSNFMKPYDPNKVSLANTLYSKLQDEVIHIDDFENIKEQVKSLNS